MNTIIEIIDPKVIHWVLRQTVKRDSLEGTYERPTLQELLSNPELQNCGIACSSFPDLYVTCELFSSGNPLCLPISTSYKSFSHRWNWNEWISFPIRFCDLPRNVLLCLTVYDCYAPGKPDKIVGGTSVSLFKKDGSFRQGQIELQLHYGLVADGNEPSSTKGKGPPISEAARLKYLVQCYHNGMIPKVDWMDRRVFREIEMILEKERQSYNELFLLIEFPQVECDNQIENLVESKHQKLARSLRSGLSDEELKPNATIRDQLQQVISYPPTVTLSSEEQDLIWKYRFYLSNNRKAVTKFLLSVPWQQPEESHQAEELMEKWSPLLPEDALELLSPRFTQCCIRKYAVCRLADATDELVQALYYQPDINSKPQNNSLATFLIKRACANPQFANYLHWYLLVECESPGSEVHIHVLQQLKKELCTVSPGGCFIYDELLRQQKFIGRLVAILEQLSKESGARLKKVERLQQLLTDGVDGNSHYFTKFAPMPLPLDPSVYVTGLLPKMCTLFKSSLMPAKLTFQTTNDKTYVAILKLGDDLRQDQLIVQLIALADRLLCHEGLDLQLTPYHVLATSTWHGLVQHQEAATLAELLATDGSVRAYLKNHSCGPMSVLLERYTRSFAGYTVLTYLLGVGDRHHDNLLVTPDGCLFHIDFGYILGRDPKPMPPAVKLSREMLDVLGGPDSELHILFRELCYTAFLRLRRHANLLLNLFALMGHSAIPDIALEPDQAVSKILDKFRPDLSDEEAVSHFRSVLDECGAALVPAVMEQFHKFAQYIRR